MKTLEQIGEEIAAALAHGTRPKEEAAHLRQVSGRHHAGLNFVNLQLLSVAGTTIEAMVEAGVDLTAAETLVATEIVGAAARLIADSKARRGETFEPGRFSVGCYGVAANVAGETIDDSEPGATIQ